MTTASSGDYALILESHAERDLNRIRGRDFDRIDAAIAALAKTPRPHGIEKLGDQTYRIRVGDWRIIYLIDDAKRVVLIARVKRRNERTYSDL